ncbi:MAG TPA: replication-relaxation family protein [Magnetospirillum sp.]|nr:replication-relaxation family protein [Magnetospirillum sp.]
MTDTAPSLPPTPKKRRVYKQRDLTRPLDTLTAAQEKVLMLLARYRYMTVRQLVECGVAKNAVTVRRDVLPRLTMLPGKNVVDVDRYWPHAMTRGSFSYVYALTAYGAEVVAERLGVDTSAVRYPAGGIQFVNDFFHREAYVDFCIALHKWIDSSELRHCRTLTHYFDKMGANRKGQPSRSVNRLELPKNRPAVVPDGLALVDTESKRRALAIEIHHKTDTKRAVEKLVELMHALSAGVIEQHLGHDKAAFILSVATTPELNATIRKRMAEVSGIEKYAPVFLFNDLQTIMREGFNKGWTHCGGAAAGVFC